MKTVELWIAMDAEGEWGFGADADTAIEYYTDNYSLAGPLRVVCIHVNMNPPAVQDPVSVTVPDEAGQTVTAEVSS